MYEYERPCDNFFPLIWDACKAGGIYDMEEFDHFSNLLTEHKRDNKACLYHGRFSKLRLDNFLEELLQYSESFEDIRESDFFCYQKGHSMIPCIPRPINRAQFRQTKQAQLVYSIPYKWLKEPTKYEKQLNGLFFAQNVSNMGFIFKIKDLPKEMVETQEKVYNQWGKILKARDSGDDSHIYQVLEQSKGNSGFAVNSEPKKVDFCYSTITPSLNSPSNNDKKREDPENCRDSVKLESFSEWKSQLTKLNEQRGQLVSNLFTYFCKYLQDNEIGPLFSYPERSSLRKLRDIPLESRDGLIRYQENDSEDFAINAHIDRGLFTYLGPSFEREVKQEPLSISTDNKLVFPVYPACYGENDDFTGCDERENLYACEKRALKFDEAIIQGGLQISMLSSGAFRPSSRGIVNSEERHKDGHLEDIPDKKYCDRIHLPTFYNVDKQTVLKYSEPQLELLKDRTKLPTDVAGFVFEEDFNRNLNADNSIETERFFRNTTEQVTVSCPTSSASSEYQIEDTKRLKTLTLTN